MICSVQEFANEFKTDLPRVAIDLLCCPPTSTASERLFSCAVKNRRVPSPKNQHGFFVARRQSSSKEKCSRYTCKLEQKGGYFLRLEVHISLPSESILKLHPQIFFLCSIPPYSYSSSISAYGCSKRLT